MSDIIQAKSREVRGTGRVRAIRREGLVPGIIYGRGKEPEPIAIEKKDLLLESVHAHFFSKVYQIDVGGKKQAVIAKDLQLHPVTDLPLHVDFLRVEKDSRIHVFVPIEYIHEDKSPGIKKGGVLNVILHTIEVVCPANAIPEKFTISLEGLELGHSVHLNAIELDSKVVVAHPDRDNTFATIVAPSGMKEEESAPTTEGAQAAPASPTTTT